MPTQNDWTKIQTKIAAIRTTDQRDDLQSKFDYFVRPELVQIHDFAPNTSKEAILKYAADNLHRLEIVEPTFLNELLERERLSSTAFDTGVAIPHSMHMNSQVTRISIIKPQQVLTWDGQPVKFIFVIAKNRKDAKIFNGFFQTLIELLSDTYTVDFLYTAQTTAELLQRLSQCLTQQI